MLREQEVVRSGLHLGTNLAARPHEGETGGEGGHWKAVAGVQAEGVMPRAGLQVGRMQVTSEENGPSKQTTNKAERPEDPKL